MIKFNSYDLLVVPEAVTVPVTLEHESVTWHSVSLAVSEADPIFVPTKHLVVPNTDQHNKTN